MSTDVTDEIRDILRSVLEAGPDIDDAGMSMECLAAWDSMAHISIILAVEQRFRVQLTPEEAMMADSLDQLRAVVESKR